MKPEKKARARTFKCIKEIEQAPFLLCYECALGTNRSINGYKMDFEIILPINWEIKHAASRMASNLWLNIFIDIILQQINPLLLLFSILKPLDLSNKKNTSLLKLTTEEEPR